MGDAYLGVRRLGSGEGGKALRNVGQASSSTESSSWSPVILAFDVFGVVSRGNGVYRILWYDGIPRLIRLDGIE